MSQHEVYKFLKQHRALSDEWLEAKQIKDLLIKKGITNSSIKNVSNNLYKLSAYNLIQFKGVGLWDHKKLFRAYKNK